MHPPIGVGGFLDGSSILAHKFLSHHYVYNDMTPTKQGSIESPRNC